jgi:AcrR family transcriptional regulator
MARAIPADRFSELVRTATRVFVAQGYRRTQMADIARELGIAKGTLYLYVEGKQALFWLCAQHCDAAGPIERPDPLPVPTPARGELARLLSRRVEAESRLPALDAALAREPRRDVRGELEEILRELYRAMRRNRHALELIDRCGQDHPELSAALQREMRETTQRRLARYLESRGRAGGLRPAPDAFLRARVVIETLTTWAVHIGRDPVPQRFEAKQVEDEVVVFVREALLRDGRST